MGCSEGNPGLLKYVAKKPSQSPSSAQNRQASPLKNLLEIPSEAPKTLLIQAVDDPWVPHSSAKTLLKKVNDLNSSSRINIVLTNKGGHNGFHGEKGCWGDQLAKEWLLHLVN